jgi:hypothetical protein
VSGVSSDESTGGRAVCCKARPEEG